MAESKVFDRQVVLVKSGVHATDTWNTTIIDASQVKAFGEMGYYPVAEPALLTFTELAPEVVCKGALAVLEAKANAVRAEAESKLTAIAEERAAHLQLMHKPEGPAEDPGGLEGAELAGGDA
jgi:hypothetical protein